MIWIGLLALVVVDLSVATALAESVQSNRISESGKTAGVRKSSSSGGPVVAFTQIGDRSTAEDTPTPPIAFGIAVSDPLAISKVKVSGSSSDTNLVHNEDILISGANASWQVVVRPATNQFGVCVITLAADAGGPTTPTFFRLTITPVNDAPTVQFNNLDSTKTNLFPQGVPILISAEAADYDGMVANLTVLRGSEILTQAAANRLSYSWQPVPGNYVLTAVATDDQGVQATNRPVNISVVPVSQTGGTTVTEGQDAVIFVGNPEPLGTKTNRLNYFTIDGTALAGIDYVYASGTLTNKPTDIAKSVTIKTVNDSLHKPDRQFLVFFTNPDNLSLAPLPIVITIKENDLAPTVSIQDAPSVKEGGPGTANMAFTVRLSAPSGQGVSVDYSTSDGSAKAGVDYTWTNATVFFNPGDTNRTILIPVLGDALNETNENFFVSLLVPADNALVDTTRNLAQGVIIDDDPLPAILIKDATAKEGNVFGTNTIVFQVSLSAPSGQEISVDYATTNRTAIAGSDYLSATGKLTFAAGQTNATVAIRIFGDTFYEPDEDFLVTLTNPRNATVVPQLAQARGTITNDDGLPTILISDIKVDEGDTGTTDATFTISLSGPSSTPVTVSYSTTNFTAIAGFDYVSTNGTLVFSPGTITNAITVAVIGDKAKEEDEAFVVTLTNPVGATLPLNQFLGVIADHDALPGLFIDDRSLVEGNSGTANAVFTVTLSAAAAEPVIVSLVTADGTASAQTDYLPVNQPLIFNPGVTTNSVPIPIIGDLVHEPDETFLVTLTNASSNATIVKRQGQGTIVNNDSPPFISIAEMEMAEGPVGQTNAGFFTVTLSSESALPVSVDYATSNDLAVSGEDFVATSGRLFFFPGQTTQTITVPIIGDALNEVDETFFVNLTNPTNAISGKMEGLGQINNDDPLPTLSVSDVSVSESDNGTNNALVVVSLSALSGQVVSVNFTSTTNGVAAAGSDYLPVSGKLTFALGATNQVITVPVVGDTRPESDEDVSILLREPVNATITGRNPVRVIIEDDDAAPAISIADVTVTEGTGTSTKASFAVRLAPAGSLPVTVDFATADGTAKASADYFGNSGTLTFNPGETNATVTVILNSDSLNETNETFFVNLSNPLYATIAQPRAEALIIDDDSAPEISINDVSVLEGNTGTFSAVFSVTLSAASGQTVSVDFATTNDTASAGIDYQLAKGAIVFNPGETFKAIPVTINSDFLHEPNERFSIILSRPVNATIRQGQGTAVIVNDDPAPGLSIADATVAEGNSGTTNAVFDVRLSAPSAQKVTVDFTTANGTAAAGNDFDSTSGSLSFNPGETNQTITVAVQGDLVDEPDEIFFLNLSNPSNAIVLDGQGLATIVDDDNPPAISIAGEPIPEGNSGTVDAVFTVSLSTASAQTVTVNYATTNGTATAGIDYVSNRGTVTFRPGETRKAIPVQVIGDRLDEPEETFVVALSNPANATLATSFGLGTILNDDPPPEVSIDDITMAEGDSGLAKAIFTVNLSAPSAWPVTVDFATADGTAKNPGDYFSNPGTVTFNSGETFQTISVLINGDRLSESNETFFVNLANPQHATLDRSRGQATIVDDDPLPSLTIGDVEIAEGNAGSAVALFNVTLSAARLQLVTVDFVVADGSAQSGLDFTATSGKLIFNPGETNKPISVPVLGDTLAEGNEDFFVRLGNPLNATLAAGQGRGVIIDDDGAPSLFIFDRTADPEGNDGLTSAIMTVSLSAPSDRTVTVDFATANGTAKVGDDFLAAAGTLVFGPRETKKTITVLVQGDVLYEGDEALTVNLSNAANATLGKSQARLAIIDDDPWPVISIADLAVSEGNVGPSNAVFLARLSAPSGLAVTVNFATAEGTAVAGSDYDAVQGTVTFEPGETAKPIVVPLRGDTLSESNKTFFVTLSNPVNAAPGRMQASGLILDDDLPPAISITDAGGLSEGNTGTTNAIFQVNLSRAAGQPVTVNFVTADGTASAGTDYAAQAGQLTFNSGETNKVITVAVQGDIVIEPDETFFVNLSAPVNATLLDNQGVATIANDDAPLALSISDAAVTEGNSGSVNAVFAVSLSAPSDRNVTVEYSTSDDTANAGSDYLSATGSVTFAPGTTNQAVAVAIWGDALDEDDERFWVNLSNPNNAAIRDGQGVGTITDDDPAPRLAVDDVSAIEGTAAVFTVRLSAPSSRAVTVQFATTNGTATAGLDYTASSGSLEFPPGATNQTIRVVTTDDVLTEPGENFLVLLSNPAHATISDAQGLATIIDNDTLPTVSIRDATVPEGDSGPTNAVFAVTLSSPSAQNVSVNFSTADGTARSGDDFAAGSGTLIFPPGTTNRNIVVTVNGDKAKEPNETFFVNLSSPIGAALGIARGTGTIIDDDVEATLSITDAAVVEGHSGRTQAVFTVRLSTASSQTVTLNFATADGSATAGTDYTARSGQLTFTPGTITNAVVVDVLGDLLDEPNETFTVRLSDPRNAVLTDDAGQGTILNDDIPPTLAITDAAVTEGNSGTTNAVFLVRLSTPSGQAVTVDFQTAPGTAAAATDYVSASGKLTFPPGSVIQSIPVAVRGDSVVESDETFFVNLTNAGNARLTDSQGQGTILNDDAAVNTPPLVTLTSPANGTAFTSPATITITADAHDRDGAIQRVDFFVGVTLLGSVSQAPFTFTWDNEAAGAYSLTAVATDNEGAMTTSGAVQILVSRSPFIAKVAIVRNAPHPEITQLQNYLLDLGVSSQVFDQEGLTFDAVSDARLIIWEDLGLTTQGLTDNDVRVFQQARDDGLPLYFIGETLAAVAKTLSAASQSRWLNLIHLQAATSQHGNGVVSIDGTADHPVTRGHFGVAGNFSYASVADGVFQPAFGATLLAKSGTVDVLVAYEDDAGGIPFRTVTQDFLVTNGPDAHDRAEQKRIFKNTVAWLLRNEFQALTDLGVTLTGPQGPVKAGQELTYTATVSQRGEIAATGVSLTIPLPAGVQFVSAAFLQGSLGETNDVIVYNLGNLENGQQTTFSFVVRPTLAGKTSIAGNVSGNEADPIVSNNSEALVIEVAGGSLSQPLLGVQRLDSQRLQLSVTSDVVRSFRIQASTNLVNWIDLTNFTGQSSVVTLSDLALPNLRQRFYRVVSP